MSDTVAVWFLLLSSLYEQKRQEFCRGIKD